MNPEDRKTTTLIRQVDDDIYKHGGQITKKQFDDFTRKTKVGKPFLDSLFVSRISKDSKKVIAQLQEQHPEIIIGKRGQLNLTIHQQRILDALLKKFSDNDFPIVNEVKLDGLRITRTELLELAGCERIKHKDGKSRFSGHEAERLQEALRELAITPQLVITKNRVGNTVYTYETLVKVGWEMDETVSPKTVAGSNNPAQNKNLNRRLRYYLIALPPFVLAGVRSSFRLLPDKQYSEIKAYKQCISDPGRVGVTKTEILFIKWLHRHGIGKQKIRINWLNLAAQLRLESQIENRKWETIKQILSGLYELALGLGYIQDYKTEIPSSYTKDKTIDVLYLNPERIIHAGSKLVSRGIK